jgi:segregation and condensation protein B
MHRQPSRLASQILAVLFAAGRPVSLQELAPLAPSEALKQALDELKSLLCEGSWGIDLEEVAGGWRLVVHLQQVPVVEQILRATPPRLSRAALEVLAILAHAQPLTRAEIEARRGKSVEGTLESLVERGLVEVVGHKETLGRPRLYGVGARFFEVFGLRSLDELPSWEGVEV